MGISGGINFYYSIKNLELKDILAICRKESNLHNPQISVDCNWVANYIGRTRGDYIKKTVDVLAVLRTAGFKVCPVIDGDIRHHSKRVTVGERSLEKDIASVNVLKTGQGPLH